MRAITILLLIAAFMTVYGQDSDSLLNINKRDDPKMTVVPMKDNYIFVYDGLYDMNGSAQNLLSVSNLLGRGLDELSCNQDTGTGFNYCAGKDNYFGRILIDVGLNYFFTNWLSIVQHEWMGHGFRLREFNVKVNSYDVTPNLFGQPQVYFNRDDLPYYGKVLEDVAGSESNTIFAREAFRQSLLNDYFYHYYIYSFVLKLDLPFYIIGTPKVGSYAWYNYTGGGWDVVYYIKDFATKSKDNEQAIYNAAKKGALWSFADPSLLISIFNYARDFIINGKSQVTNPMINVDNVAFLPYTDFHLSPFGYEYYAGTYLKYNKALLEAYYRWSNGNIDGKSYGIGFNMINLIRFNSFKFDVGLDIWEQGFNLLYYETDNVKYHEKILSGKIYLKPIYKINNTFSFLGQVSYKGDGVLLGNPITHGFNAKIGIGCYF
jgi:hypothetical protein